MLSTLLITETLAFQNKLEMQQWGSALEGGNSCGDSLVALLLSIPEQREGEEREKQSVGLKGLTAHKNKSLSAGVFTLLLLEISSKKSVCVQRGRRRG